MYEPLFYLRSERGTYYALHLGGSYFRIIRVHLGGQRSSLEVQDIERHSIPTSLLNSTSEVTMLAPKIALFLARFIKIQQSSILLIYFLFTGSLRLSRIIFAEVY